MSWHDLETADVLEFRIDGEARLFLRTELAGGRRGLACTQQALVRCLIRDLLAAGGDLRFSAADVELHELEGARPRVTYRDASGRVQAIGCRFVAGCDGRRSATRASVPPGALNAHSHRHGARLAVHQDELAIHEVVDHIAEDAEGRIVVVGEEHARGDDR